jgi:hypothetical protein
LVADAKSFGLPSIVTKITGATAILLCFGQTRCAEVDMNAKRENCQRKPPVGMELNEMQAL